MSQAEQLSVARVHEVRSAPEMDEVLRCPALEKRGHGNSPHAEEFVLGGTLIYIWGEEHRRRRRMYAPLVSAAALRDIEAWMVPAFQWQLRTLPSGPDGRVRADIVLLARDLSLAIAARIIGLDDMEPPDGSLARLERLGALGDRLVASLKAHLEFEGEAKRDAAQAMGAASRDKERFIAGRIADAKAAKQCFIDEYYRPSRERRERLVAEHRAGRLDAAQLPKDLITLLILNDEQLRAEPSWDEDLPVRECTMTLAASDHTTSMAACHAIADLYGWVATHPADAARLTDPGFLRRAVQESLRLHQITDPAINWRHAKEDVVLATGRKIESGDRVALWYGIGGLDPDYYGADCAEFNPWREEPGRLRRPAGFAFSGGSKVCLGQALVIGAGDGDEFKGDLPLMLQACFEAGMRTDPERPAVPRAHVHARDDKDHREIYMWKSFPVIFDRLGTATGKEPE